ncbi:MULTISPECIES: DUF433 domain-containing protein [unclassified Coleofasciculus]|uniref:DUF433 domain-containing protein n=1 Tax=unclassified Coleofasciculus TaxID=2692782 RepID=UPI0018812DBB|nr:MULTISPECIES: DUF433 domain-containing protein [unclassified Coleofasciculus]MBE9126671.1 DUF433 domain-containing protein [Coleofasciculus sp. LEGE 07081]MBE9148513.1 DUF433 domain-containing protein [Coleofasciculus sp. LEGE 07092]
MPTTTEYKYVQLNDKGVPVIAGTTLKVIELVMAQIAYGWSPDELQVQHPYLSMSQIYSALAYYWDYKEVIDAEIEESLQWAKQVRKEAGISPVAAKLRAKGLLV